MRWQLLWNNILDLVFLGKKIPSRNDIECVLFEDLLRRGYPNSTGTLESSR